MTGGNWFVGVVLPAAGWFPERVGTPPPDVRLFHPDDLHLTVAFLGPCGPERAAAAWAALGDLPGPVDAVLAGAAAFGGRRPSALAVTVAGADALVDGIAAARDAVLDAAGVARDDRPVRLHGTFARVGRRASREAYGHARAWLDGLDVAGVPVRLDTVALFAWSEARPVRQFRRVAERVLGAPR